MEKKLIIISGPSGAGKTTASVILESMGYRCIDSYPEELLDELVDLLEKDQSPKYARTAMTVSLSSLSRFEKLLSNSLLSPRLILLDCDENVLIQRYKFSRRVHPLMISNTVNSLNEAITLEKELMKPYLVQGVRVIDTTHLSVKQHKEALIRLTSGNDVRDLTIGFESFGFKKGAPSDADIVIDVRMLDNPFYVPELRAKTGLDKEVADFVLDNDKGRDFLKRLTDYLDFVFASYDDHERRHLTVCVGCTGGQHRSVAVAEYLYQYYGGRYMCSVHHREGRSEL